MKLPILKLSVCPCGAPLLREDIPIGTEYEVDPLRQIQGVLTCFACKKDTHLVCCWVESRVGGGEAGYLPVEILGVPALTREEMFLHEIERLRKLKSQPLQPLPRRDG